ncbi:hypothetical protein D3C85_1611290 [compost metagenome]
MHQIRAKAKNRLWIQSILFVFALTQQKSHLRHDRRWPICKCIFRMGLITPSGKDTPSLAPGCRSVRPVRYGTRRAVADRPDRPVTGGRDNAGLPKH